MKNREKILKIVFSAMFLALCYVLPFLTGQIPEIGSMLCPMHIPVLLCGFVCGWPWGLVVGITAPLLRSFTLSMPPLFPTAICMAFELQLMAQFPVFYIKYSLKRNLLFTFHY
jgi:thiamine transporter ThiT